MNKTEADRFNIFRKWIDSEKQFCIVIRCSSNAMKLIILWKSFYHINVKVIAIVHLIYVCVCVCALVMPRHRVLSSKLYSFVFFYSAAFCFTFFCHSPHFDFMHKLNEWTAFNFPPLDIHNWSNSNTGTTRRNIKLSTMKHSIQKLYNENSKLRIHANKMVNR